jgi:hypothetical protein
MAQSCRTSLSGANTPVSPPTGVDNNRRVFAETNPTLEGIEGNDENNGLVTGEGEVGVTKSTEADVIHKYAEFHAEGDEDRHVTTEVVQSGTGLNRGVLEKALEDRWSCDPKMDKLSHGQGLEWGKKQLQLASARHRRRLQCHGEINERFQDPSRQNSA